MSEVNAVGWRWWLWPLKSRKVQVALATIVAAWAVHLGLPLAEDQIVSVLSWIGSALILGIAVEDAAKRATEPRSHEVTKQDGMG